MFHHAERDDTKKGIAMHSIAPAEYLVTEVLTAPPQKLQLMLIEAALRFSAKAKKHWRAGQNAEAGEAILRAQEIVSEILSGIRPEADRDLANKVSAIYGFVFQCLVAAHIRSDAGKLDEAVKVLEVERETWQSLCARMSHTQAPVEPPALQISGGFSLRA
jgi:flagellar protein FliS